MRGAYHRGGVSFLVALALGLMGAGCSSLPLSGTPWAQPPAKPLPATTSTDRVNAWPLLYYRPPSLSILWPLMEFSDERTAVRPFFSVYGLNRTNREYNVLWPLSQFDEESGQNRALLFFWGNDYSVLFPLYWHLQQPFGQPGTFDGMPPLWTWYRDREHSSAYFPWPIAHTARSPQESGWYAWPLAGSYTRPDGYFRFQAWPLAFQASADHGSNRWDTVIPLYYRGRSPDASTFLSIPWSQYRSERGDSWQCMPPVFFRASRESGTRSFYTLLGGTSHAGSKTQWMILPLLSGGHTDAQGTSGWAPFPIVHWQSTPNTYSRLVLPVFYASGSPESRSFFTLLGGASHSGDRTQWLIPPLLSGGRTEPQGASGWAPFPLVHWQTTTNTYSRLVLPLFYASREPDRSRFISIPYSHGSADNDSRWTLTPPLYYGRTTRDSTCAITPLWSSGATTDGRKRWQLLMPAYYWRRDGDEHLLATLIGGFSTDRWLVYPLLSWGHSDKAGGEAWILAPLMHSAWGDQGDASHVLPLYYRNGQSGTFVSPLVARWRSAQSQTAALPLLLSALTRRQDRNDMWALAPLSHFSWGPQRGSSHVFPLYYTDPRSGTFASLLAARWRSGDAQTLAAPLLLSAMTETKERSDLWAVAPLSHFSWGSERGSSYVFPLYYNNPRSGTFASLPLVAWQDGVVTNRLYPPLLSLYSKDRAGADFWGALGLYHSRMEEGRLKSGHLIPLYGYEQDDHLWTPVFGWQDGVEGFVYPFTPLAGYRTGAAAGGWLFPLFSRHRSKATGDTSGWVLWGRYWSDASRSGSSLFPVYWYRNSGPIPDAAALAASFGTYGRDFLSLPCTWYRNQCQIRSDASNRVVHLRYVHANGTFPFWSFSREADGLSGEETVQGSVLIRIYDYLSRTEGAKGPADVRRYSRSRVLWRVWRCERTDGDVSVDMIPAITYDRKADGFKKITFLWRAFRYERTAGGDRKMDIAFIPVMRHQARP